ncbi:MAG: xanthine dehydrogenase family protein subunit M [Rhodobacterales bacterium]|nr:xanthine dehydrogenase family protein subunit M [Rhodobacterales bacterium]MDX5413056.1 xanthine dehydrogenase family protein subunit M [Rhodobacterales bacterium]
MRAFDYRRVPDVAAATEAAQDTEASYIAGGTNLVDLMKLEVATPARLVDISRLPLDRISPTDDGGLRIGAMVSNSDLAADMQVRRHFPLLARAILAGASGQIRNKASVGGNLLQRTRCAWFQDIAAACNKRAPGTGCAAQDGPNRMNAVLGVSDHCIAAHPSDMAVALRALDAQVEVTAADGSARRVRMDDFYRLPGDTPQIETCLAQGDLVTAVILPPPLGETQVYRKIRDRASYAFALVSVAATLRMEEGKIAAVRLAFGGVAPRPWNDAAVELLLTGKPPSEDLFARAGQALVAKAVGHGGNDFKIPMLQRLLSGVLREVCA